MSSMPSPASSKNSNRISAFHRTRAITITTCPTRWSLRAKDGRDALLLRRGSPSSNYPTPRDGLTPSFLNLGREQILLKVDVPMKVPRDETARTEFITSAGPPAPRFSGAKRCCDGASPPYRQSGDEIL